jgi:hypothetical protein
MFEESITLLLLQCLIALLQSACRDAHITQVMAKRMVFYKVKIGE